MAVSPPEGGLHDDEAPHDNEDEAPEARDLKIKLAPSAPTQAEIERHNASHYPPRVWCKYCVQGRMREMRHQQMKEHNDNP